MSDFKQDTTNKAVDSFGKERTEEEIKELKMLQTYRQKGIKIGMATDDGSPLNEVNILSEVNNYRQIVKPDCPIITDIEVFDSPFAVSAKYKECQFNNANYGNHDIQWLIGGLCKKVEYGDATISEAIYPLLALANQIGWFWMDNKKLCVSRRPSRLVFRRKTYPNAEELAANFDETSIMVGHNPDGMAIQYWDNTGVFILNGIRIPAEHTWIITDKEKLTLASVMAIKNTELRGEALKLLPVDQFQKGMGFKVVHEATVMTGGVDGAAPLHYELLEMVVDDDVRKYLKGTCPSEGKVFNEGVPPECLTVQQALNWRELEMDIGDCDVNTFVPPVIRT